MHTLHSICQTKSNKQFENSKWRMSWQSNIICVWYLPSLSSKRNVASLLHIASHQNLTYLVVLLCILVVYSNLPPHCNLAAGGWEPWELAVEIRKCPLPGVCCLGLGTFMPTAWGSLVEQVYPFHMSLLQSDWDWSPWVSTAIWLVFQKNREIIKSRAGIFTWTCG